jgi:ABC-type arginine transport system ATPase subunit
VRIGERHFEFDGRKSRLPKDRELAAFRARTGMVFQHFNLFPHMTALENVMEGMVTVLRTPKAKPARKRWNCCRRWAWQTAPTCIRKSSPAARSSASPSPARWPCSRT